MSNNLSLLANIKCHDYNIQTTKVLAIENPRYEVILGISWVEPLSPHWQVGQRHSI